MFGDNDIHPSCSCPFERICKHIVAVLLALESKSVRKERKNTPNWKEKLSLLSKEELIKLLIPFIESDPDIKIPLLNTLAGKGIDTTHEKYQEYWTEAKRLLDNFHGYGGGSDEDGQTIEHDLNEIVKLCKKGLLSPGMKNKLLKNLLTFYLGANTGLDDLLVDTIFRVADTRNDWLNIIKQLQGKNCEREHDLIIKIYRDFLKDKENYLKERTKDLKYGLDYYDLVQFYEENGNKEKAVKFAEEGVNKGEGRKIDLYEFLFNHYQEKRDYGNALRCLREIFKEDSSLKEYKRLIGFSRNKKEDSHWAQSLLNGQKRFEVLAEIDLHDRRYDNVLKYVVDERYDDFFGGKEALAEKIKTRYPHEIISFYKNLVENCINEKTRKAYTRAAYYLRKIKHIYLRVLKNELLYHRYISALREEFVTRPALLDEISNL